MRVLLVKTSSLGDVIHNLPVVSDLRKTFPHAVIDWVVEESFADIPRLHPGVREVIPVALRRWRTSLLMRQTWQEMRAFGTTLRREHYDLVTDTQGLLKSALLARLARGHRAGYAAASAREPLAARFYTATFAVSRDMHAVARNRLLAAHAAGYALAGAPDYGLAARGGPQGANLPAPAFAGLSEGGLLNPSLDKNPFLDDTVVLLTATSRADKLWPEQCWLALGCALAERGFTCLLPSGNTVERARAAQLAHAIPGAVALPSMRLRELAGQLAAARLVIGVDTGLVHLAAALGRPTLALFCASDPALTGVLAGRAAINLGAPGAPPDVAAVLAAAQPWL